MKKLQSFPRRVIVSCRLPRTSGAFLAISIWVVLSLVSCGGQSSENDQSASVNNEQPPGDTTSDTASDATAVAPTQAPTATPETESEPEPTPDPVEQLLDRLDDSTKEEIDQRVTEYSEELKAGATQNGLLNLDASSYAVGCGEEGYFKATGPGQVEAYCSDDLEDLAPSQFQDKQVSLQELATRPDYFVDSSDCEAHLASKKVPGYVLPEEDAKDGIAKCVISSAPGFLTSRFIDPGGAESSDGDSEENLDAKAGALYRASKIWDTRTAN